jgi:LPS export ABC transporter protein LptC
MSNHPAPVSCWITALALSVACTGTSTGPGEGEFTELPADQVMIDVQFSSTSKGIRAAELKSDTAYLFSDSAVTHLRGVDLEMYDASGRQTAHLTSVTGVYNQNTQAMIGRGDVVLIVLADGRRIETEELYYDPEQRRIWSDVETHMTLPDGTDITTSNFTADDEFRNVQTGTTRGRSPATRIRF